jgi:hypothetical protein
MPLSVVIDLHGKKHTGEIVHIKGDGVRGYIIMKENGKVVKIKGFIENSK